MCRESPVSHNADLLSPNSNTIFHDHYKASLVSHSDSNGDEDTGKLHVTYANNHWKNINSRMPLIRFGTSHIFNSYYEGGSVGDTAINTRMGTFKP
jgi:pectate lyase